jgi:uncharacterized membrane protein YeaQ/YmgE (transglycosylase-associated protein family)
MFQELLYVLSTALPLVGFLAQYAQTRKDKRDAFSTQVTLLGIVGAVFGLAFHWMNDLALSFGIIASAGATIAIHLFLLELIVRLRREQRMLPESWFLRLSFRPK